jgi:hypothetical protein
MSRNIDQEIADMSQEIHRTAPINRKIHQPRHARRRRSCRSSSSGDRRKELDGLRPMPALMQMVQVLFFRTQLLASREWTGATQVRSFDFPRWTG